jgi:hypothetical protein
MTLMQASTPRTLEIFRAFAANLLGVGLVLRCDYVYEHVPLGPSFYRQRQFQTLPYQTEEAVRPAIKPMASGDLVKSPGDFSQVSHKLEDAPQDIE